MAKAKRKAKRKAKAGTKRKKRSSSRKALDDLRNGALLDRSHEFDDLVQAATEVRKHAHAPYSNFHVGAALRCKDGTVIEGCNVENASYGLSLCAERSAVARAVAQGYLEFDALAVVTSTSPPAPPCGLCLQTLAEFADDLPVILANPAGERIRIRLTSLLPVRFRPENLT